MLASAALDPSGWTGPLRYALERPVQAESLPATVLCLLSCLHSPGGIARSFNSVNIVSGSSATIAAAFELAFVAALVTRHFFRDRISRCRRGAQLVDACCVASHCAPLHAIILSRMILSIGDLVLDVTIVPDRSLHRDDDTPASIWVGGGGQAANFCAWTAALGEDARLVCRVGRDDTADRLVGELIGVGVDVRAVRGDDPTGVIAVMVGLEGERSMLTQRGASVGLRPEDLQRQWFDGAQLLHLPAYSLFREPLAAASWTAVGMARDQGAAIAVDLSSAAGISDYGPQRMVADLERLKPQFLFATAAEAAVLESTFDDLADHAVVKLGASGCQVGHRRITAPPVDVVDATGAGDALAAAFCSAVIGGANEVEAAERAVMVAAEAVGILGARPPRRERSLP
jgi:sugar/nucleoside kinase (ribokinase family)